MSRGTQTWTPRSSRRTATDTSAIALGLTPKEVKRYSLGRALVASITGNWSEAGFERECSNAMAKQQGREAEGFLLPPDVFRRDFNVGTASEAGNLVATDLRGDLFVDVLRNNLVMGQLGARILTGLSSNIDLPRKSAGATIGTVDRENRASTSDPLALRVYAPPRVETSSLADATAGSAYHQELAVSGDPAPEVTVTGLPDGLAYSGGAITGSTTAAGTYPVTVTATNLVGEHARELTLTVNPGAPFAVSTVSGSGQGTTFGTSFGAPLVARVVRRGARLGSGADSEPPDAPEA